MGKKVWDVVRGAGFLTTIFSKLAQAMEKIGGTQEQLHRLSTDEGQQAVELMAEVVVRGPRLGNEAIRPGMCIFLHKGRTIAFGDGRGNSFYWRCGSEKTDKQIADFLRNEDDFRSFACLLARMFELTIKPTNSSAMGFQFVDLLGKSAE